MKARAFIGGVAGGSTRLYGACLMRPGQIDFSPGKYYSRYLDRFLDGSFMPTSLGVAPALTIMANALRVFETGL